MNNYQYITSKDNEKIKQIKALENKKDRYENRLFVIEGIKPVLEAIDSEYAVECLVFSKDLLININNGKEMIEKLEEINNINIVETSAKVLEYLSDTVTSQGIIAILHMKELSFDSIINSNEKIIILDRLQDPGNVGTIIRSADAFNVKNIICIKGTADPYMQKVVRSTMGSILRVNICTVSEEPEEIENKIILLKNNGYNICVTTLKGATDLRDVKLDNKCIFVIGNEAKGVSQLLDNFADIKIKIPMENTAESLNASIATGILLYNQYIS